MATSNWRVITRENVTNIYGRDPRARIEGPAPDGRVFSWLIEETHDDRGNIAQYTYKPEDGQGVPRTLAEESRFAPDDPARFVVNAQRYLKRVRYGNRTPFVSGNWCFEVVFDYGDHDASVPTPEESGPWPARLDPFSTYKPGFEVRTYRLCRRILMFHRFPELSRDPARPRAFSDLGRDATLVRSTDLVHESSPVLTYLVSAQQVGYVRDRDGYRRATLPALELDYARRKLHDEVAVLDETSLDGMANGFDPASMQWQDLDGEGLPGVLLTQPRGWFFKENLGNGKLGGPAPLRSLPAPAELAGGLQQLSDVDGDGRLEVVSYQPPLAGCFSRTPEGSFSSFRPFRELPNIDWQDPNLRFLDLDGDGHADVLITEHDAFVWLSVVAKSEEAPVEKMEGYQNGGTSLGLTRSASSTASL